MPVEEYSLAHLRDAVAMVLQKNTLFSGSLRENLLWGNPEAPDEELLRACRIARVDEFLDRLENGLDTEMGQGGSNISGGQKQRICIARALAVHPEVLLMDESTSALDPISTSKIEDLVMDIKKEYTIVMVTHNMQQAVRVSDTTVFFLLGEIIESGATGQMFSVPKDKRTEDYITGRFG